MVRLLKHAKVARRLLMKRAADVADEGGRRAARAARFRRQPPSRAARRAAREALHVRQQRHLGQVGKAL